MEVCFSQSDGGSLSQCNGGVFFLEQNGIDP